MELFLHVDTWIILLTLTFLEIILGIDNIIFISITAGKLPEKSQIKATRFGLLLAMVFRILLLLGVSYLIALKNPFFSFDLTWLKADITGQSLILISGGIFLLSLLLWRVPTNYHSNSILIHASPHFNRRISVKMDYLVVDNFLFDCEVTIFKTIFVRIVLF